MTAHIALYADDVEMMREIIEAVELVFATKPAWADVNDLTDDDFRRVLRLMLREEDWNNEDTCTPIDDR